MYFDTDTICEGEYEGEREDTEENKEETSDVPFEIKRESMSSKYETWKIDFYLALTLANHKLASSTNKSEQPGLPVSVYILNLRRNWPDEFRLLVKSIPSYFLTENTWFYCSPKSKRIFALCGDPISQGVFRTHMPLKWLEECESSCESFDLLSRVLTLKADQEICVSNSSMIRIWFSPFFDENYELCNFKCYRRIRNGVDKILEYAIYSITYTPP